LRLGQDRQMGVFHSLWKPANPLPFLICKGVCGAYVMGNGLMNDTCRDEDM